MFKTFLLVSFLVIFFVIYNTYFSNKDILALKLNKEGTLNAIIYTKSHCPYCVKAKDLLDKLKITYQEFSLNDNVDLHKKLITETNQRTVPYLYINERFIGGYDQLSSLHKNGKI